jgi:cysteine desulfurase
MSDERARYFDNAATTPLDPRVLEAMLPALRDDWGNAHSIHACGLRAMAAVEQAREAVAELVGAEDPSQIVFTSGATEANNWVLHSFEHGLISPFEHSSVLEPAQSLGYTVLANDGFTLHPPDQPAPLISVMKVDNETGAIFEPEQVRPWAKALHTDATQALGKIAFDVSLYDFASMSSHKFYGPKGIGALYIQGDAPIQPYMLGGEQETGRRAGTLNVPAIIGMGEAARLAQDEIEVDQGKANRLRPLVLSALEDVPDWRINGHETCSPFILSISFLGVEGESLVIDLDRSGFAISSGAACSSRSTEPSHVLTALGLETQWLRGTVRLSFGRFNTEEAAEELGRALTTSVTRLRNVR